MMTARNRRSCAPVVVHPAPIRTLASPPRHAGGRLVQAARAHKISWEPALEEPPTHLRTASGVRVSPAGRSQTSLSAVRRIGGRRLGSRAVVQRAYRQFERRVSDGWVCGPSFSVLFGGWKGGWATAGFAGRRSACLSAVRKVGQRRLVGCGTALGGSPPALAAGGPDPATGVSRADEREVRSAPDRHVQAGRSEDVVGLDLGRGESRLPGSGQEPADGGGGDRGQGGAGDEDGHELGLAG
jgi:hypothetical protein